MKIPDKVTMISEPTYPAKLLLFGEYSILLGSKALGIPLNAFQAKLDFIDQQKGNSLIRAEESNSQLKKLADYYTGRLLIFAEFLELDRFNADVKQGLYLSSNIPQRFGMGSSGALCAAVYERYGLIKNEPILFLKEQFIQMESFFHGRSSGFDPLVIYLQKTILLGDDGDAIPVQTNSILTARKIEILLVDSGMNRPETPFVAQFLEQFAPDGIISPAAQELIRLTNSCINKFISENPEDLWYEVLNLSRFQLDTLPHLISAHLQAHWAEGLKSGLFALKICGSGGGGYFSCLTLNKKDTVKYFRNKGFEMVEV
jgi:mevalonate kinase